MSGSVHYGPGDVAVLTYDSTPQPPTWARWLMAPVGWPAFALLAICALWLLWLGRLPGQFQALIFGVWAIALFGGYWMLRQVVRVVLHLVYKQPARQLLRKWHWTVLGIALMVVTAGLIMSTAVEHIAFACSKSSFDKAAIAIRTVRPAARIHERLGCYAVTAEYRAEQDMVVFWVDDAGFLDQEGYAHNPHHVTNATGLTDLRRMSGDFYRVREVW